MLPIVFFSEQYRLIITLLHLTILNCSIHLLTIKEVEPYYMVESRFLVAVNVLGLPPRTRPVMLTKSVYPIHFFHSLLGFPFFWLFYLGIFVMLFMKHFERNVYE
jgi:hypothetical protein